jgi:hypothetical protein
MCFGIIFPPLFVVGVFLSLTRAWHPIVGAKNKDYLSANKQSSSVLI